jgi:DNA-directed RNA polymerase alpha subunit
VHRVRKFVEVGGDRIGYALTNAPLSQVSNGAKWKLDSSFNVADAILDDPKFVSVLRAVLKDGHVIVPTVKAKENRLFDPMPKLPDDTPIGDVELSPRIRRILAAWGLKTVGEVRESSDERLLSLPKLGPRSVANLRQTLGQPSTDGVRPLGKKPA